MLTATGVEAAVLDHDEFMIRPEVKPDPRAVEDAAKLLVAAESPLLVVGREVTRSDGKQEIVQLAERLSLPVVQGETLFDDFPTRHALFLAQYGWPLQKPEKYDLVVNMGSKIPPQHGILSGKTKVVHASIDAEMIGKVVPTDVGIVGDVKAARFAKIKAHTDAQRAKRAERARAGWNDRPLSLHRVAAELSQRLERDAIIVPELAVDDWLEELSFSPEEKSKIGKTTGSALGWGLGVALGVKLAQPDRQVVALQGDGGFMFAQAETLWTMARYRVPVIVVIFNNRSYNGPRNKIMKAGGRQADAGRDMTCYLGDPDVDFAKVAAGFGVSGEVVDDPNEIGPAIDRAVASVRAGKPYLVDALVARTGVAADSTWHPEYSVAALRTKKV